MEENKDDINNIIYSPALEAEIPLNKEIEVKDNSDPEKNTGNVQFRPDLESNISYDKKVNINLDEYKDYLGNDIYMPETEDGIDILNADRAKNQGVFEQAGSFLAQAVVGEIIGGTIEGLGYLLDIGSVVDVMQGDETEWGNFVTDFGQSIREGTEEATRIHQDPNATGFGKMADSGWWFSNGVSVASTLSMLLPTTGAMKALSFIGKGVGASKGMKATRKAMGIAEEMGTKGKWMTQGLSQAVLSRNIENWMEAHGTYEDAKSKYLNEINPETNEKFTDDEANRLASDAASNNWKLGWAMLLQDIPQYLAIGKIFNPISKKMEKALGAASKKGITSNMKPWQQKLTAAGVTFASEGSEESYQYLISERAKLLSDLDAGLINEKEYDEKLTDAFGSEEMLTSAFFGGLGGNLFQAAGSGVNTAFKSKKQKAFEEGMGTYYEEALKNDSKQIALMHQHLAQADQDGSPNIREHVINEMMLNLTGKALESGKFEQFYETMDQISNMGEEDKAAFLETSGTEFDSDLAKQYTPNILKTSLKMRDKYLKHRNNYGAVASNRLSRLELENDTFHGIQRTKEKEARTIREEIGDTYTQYATVDFSKMLENKEIGTVLRSRKKFLNSELKKATGPKKQFIQKAIDMNSFKLEQNAKDISDAAKLKKDRNAQEKDLAKNSAPYNDMAESAYNVYKDQIISSRAAAEEASERIIINNENIAWTKSAEGQSKTSNEEVRRKINTLKTKEDVEQALKDVNEDSELSEDDKAESLSAISRKSAEIEQLNREKRATEKAAEVSEDKARESLENNNNTLYVNNDVTTALGMVAEDENANEEVNTGHQLLDDEDKSLKSKIGTGLMGLLDKVEGTIAYQEWNELPDSKVGREFEYTVSPRSQALTNAQNDAIESFENASDPSKLTNDVFNNLPIKATLSDNSDIFTYLPTKPSINSSQEDKDNYKNGYVEQRSAIISRLKAGETVTSKVAKGSGGDLNTDYDQENKIVPEYSIEDLTQVKDVYSMDIMVTNEFGRIVDTNKELVPDFSSKTVRAGKNKKGIDIPYRGGVFLNVKKANGESFPMRLNLGKNTTAQSEILADLLIRISVPQIKRDNNGDPILNKKNKPIYSKELILKNTVSELSETLQADIKELMGPEIKMLDSKYGNPTIGSLLDTFVYVSEETKNKTTELYFVGGDENQLAFGGKRIGIETVEDSVLFKDLVEFLVEKKRRQFNLNSWNDSNDYKQYVVDNKIISTNVKPNEPMFKNTRERGDDGVMKGRRIQLYMEPVTNPTVQGPTKNSSGKIKMSNSSNRGINKIESDESNPRGITFSAESFGAKPKVSSTASPTQETIEVKEVADIEIKREKELDEFNGYKNGLLFARERLVFKDYFTGLKQGTSDIWQHKQIVKKINAKYDAELAALKPTQETSEVNIDLSKIEDYNSESFITEVNRVFNVMFKKLPKNKLGGFYPGTNEIVMSEDLSGEAIVTTLSHEVIHGIIDKMGEKTKDKLHKDLKTLFSEIKSNELKSKLDKIGKGLYREMLTKPEEFLTHGLTDPRVLDILNSIEYENKGVTSESLIDKILKIISDLVIKDNTAAKELKNVFEKYIESQPTQTSEVKISPSNIVNIMNLKTPTRPGINRILGLDLMDESAINFLEEKGIISKMEGAKGRKFLKSKEEALSILQPAQTSAKYDAELAALKPTQQTSDTQIRKENKESVSSTPRRVARPTLIKPKTSTKKRTRMGSAPAKSVDDIENMDSAIPETDCKNN